MGSMYAAVLFIGITNATAVQPVVHVERSVSYRERAAGMYSALPFAFAQVRFHSFHFFLLFLPMISTMIIDPPVANTDGDSQLFFLDRF